MIGAGGLKEGITVEYPWCDSTRDILGEQKCLSGDGSGAWEEEQAELVETEDVLKILMYYFKS